MADYVPSFKPGASITCTAGDTITGGRLVEITGDRTVKVASAGSTAVIGVAGYDATTGDNVTVFTRADGVHGLVASEAITAGASVSVADDGKIATATAPTEGGETEPGTPGSDIIGIALAAADADDVVDVLFI